MPRLETVLDRFEETAVVRLAGDLDSASAVCLRSLLRSLAHEGDDVVVDLSDLAMIDSAGLGVLVGADSWFRAQRARLRFRSPRRSVAKVLELAGLTERLVIEGMDG